MLMVGFPIASSHSSRPASLGDVMLRWSSSSSVRVLLWLALCGQLAAAFWKASPWLTADSAVYLELARNFDNLGFGTITLAGFQADALRPPGYPMILHALVEQAGMPIAALVAIQLGI